MVVNGIEDLKSHIESEEHKKSIANVKAESGKIKLEVKLYEEANRS